MRWVALPLILAASMTIGGVQAEQIWTAAPDTELETMRGGFGPAPGLLVSFGIVRTVRIDGGVVARTALHIEDLRTITLAQARQLSEQSLNMTVVQNGRGNTMEGSAVAAPGVVIQNTESNRDIQAVTEINASTTNGMRVLQGINFNQTLTDALKSALER